MPSPINQFGGPPDWTCLSQRGVVLPQSLRRRNDRVSPESGEYTIQHRIRRLVTPVFLLILSALPLAGHSDDFDWHYQPDRDHFMVRPTPLQSPVTPPTDQSAPVVLPSETWSKDTDYSRPHGWQFKRPAIGTGRVQSYSESRTAVQIAENRQTESLATSANPPPGLNELPDALRGLNYRIDFGIEYRF